MIYSMDSSHRRPRALDSDAGAGTPQSLEDGHEEATTGGPGYVTSTCSIDSSGLDKYETNFDALSRAAPDTEADVEAPKSIKLGPEPGGSNQSSSTSSGHRSTAIDRGQDPVFVQYLPRRSPLVFAAGLE